MARLYRQVLTADYGRIDELRLLADIADDMTVDTGLSVSGLRRLFATAQGIGPDDFHPYDLAGAVRNDVIGGAAVLVPDPAAVADVVQRFLTAEPAPSGAPITSDAFVPPRAGSCS